MIRRAFSWLAQSLAAALLTLAMVAILILVTLFGGAMAFGGWLAEVTAYKRVKA